MVNKFTSVLDIYGAMRKLCWQVHICNLGLAVVSEAGPLGAIEKILDIS